MESDSTGAAYREFDVETVRDFGSAFLEGPVLSSQEIGDGNLNRVFRVASATSSVIVKQAVPYLKVAGRAWPLTRHRAAIEAEAFREHAKMVPDLVPHVLHFDEAMSAIVFEDLRGHVGWRDLLVAGVDAPGVAGATARYCAAVLLGTSDVTRESRDRRELRRRFSYSELCVVTEDLVFTAPYTDAASNHYDEEIADVARSLRCDRSLRAAAAELRFAFKSRDEALIHGDLHTGSVLVGPTGAKVIDLEFAFFGPFGFDPGLLLANLALSRIAHDAVRQDAFCTVVDRSAHEFWDTFTDECRRLWPSTEPWFNRFLTSVLADAARFAGLEMIRRIVGLAHVADIDSLAGDARDSAQRHAIGGGRALVVGAPCAGFDELWLRATQEETFA